MKPLSTILFLCGMIILTAFSCEKTEKNCNEESQPVQIQDLVSLESNTQYWLQNIDDEKEIVNLVINSQSDYEKYIACNATLPTIDFKNYTLLAGRMKTPSSDVVINQSVTKNCNNYTYNVIIGDGSLGVISTVHYFTILEKVYGNVTFNIQYKNH